MIFKEDNKLFDIEIERKGGEDIMYVNYFGANFIPSIAENPEVMIRTIDALIENPGVSRIIFVQQRNYNYPQEQTLMLTEIASLYDYLVKEEGVLSPKKIALFKNLEGALEQISYFVALLKENPILCYHELESTIYQLEQQEKNNTLLTFIRFLKKIHSLLGETRLIKKSLSLSNYSARTREIYKHIFRPDILPNFTFTRLMTQIPENYELISQYNLLKTKEEIQVTILKRKEDSKLYYHILPPEYLLPEEHHLILNQARNVLAEHKPKAEEFIDPERTRRVFFDIAKNLLLELSNNQGIPLDFKTLTILSNILVRHTIGFGLIEILLLDEKIQDIVLNAPLPQNPIFIKHEEYGECVTNIIPSFEDAESWATKLRLLSGRPLDEANPILDTEIAFENMKARVAAVKEPLSPKGVAYAFRRHRDSPWTLPLFIDKKMINPLAAGLLSFIIDGARTLLVAGTRSSGKTSLLGSLMLEIMPKYRIIVLEDTLELPVDMLRKAGYNILRMKVRSALVEGSTEVEASEGIRASLRLGDSALIVGEVRSTEAKALYEAMRVGALANVVAGTIHGDSPYGVFDRVVNDLGVERTSFKATDIIVIANPVKTADGLHSVRRVINITEVRKHWNKDPSQEGGFVDLMRYNVEKDELEPTPELINGDSETIKAIAGNVKGWAGNWEEVFDNILLRGKIKEEIVELAKATKKPQVLEYKFNVLSNAVFHQICEEVSKEKGVPKSELVFPLWRKWAEREISKM